MLAMIIICCMKQLLFKCHASTVEWKRVASGISLFWVSFQSKTRWKKWSLILRSVIRTSRRVCAQLGLVCVCQWKAKKSKKWFLLHILSVCLSDGCSNQLQPLIDSFVSRVNEVTPPRHAFTLSWCLPFPDPTIGSLEWISPLYKTNLESLV